MTALLKYLSKTKCFQVILLVIFLVQFYHSQAQINKDTFDLKTVEITAKIPIENQALSRTEIDTLSLQRLQTKTLSGLISSHSPVFIKSYGRGSSATASFRGTASSHTQVNWNGVSINSPMRGDVDFSLIPVYFIDQVDLLHGGSSLTQGSGALGGSIQINNQADWNNQLEAKYIQDFESFSTFREFLQFGIGSQRFQSKTRFFHDQSANDFPFYNYGVLPYKEDVQKNADYQKYGFLQEFYYRSKTAHQLSLKIWGVHNDRNLPQLMSYEGSHRSEYQIDDEIRAIADWNYYQGNSHWQFFSAYIYHQLHYFRSSTEAEFENFNSNSTEQSSANRLEYQYKKQEKLHLRSSLDFNYHQVDNSDQVLETGYQEERLELSFLAQANYQINERLSSYFLWRTEYFDQTFIPFIPSLGLEYLLSSKYQISLLSNLTRNYHKPSLNDLYWIPGGNPNLKPEDGYTFDLGGKYQFHSHKWQVNLSANFYTSFIDNWIVWQPSSTGAYYWEAQNLKKVWARGLETQFKINWIPNKNWNIQFSGNYAYTRTTNENAVESVDESRGQQLIYIPIHTANFSFDAQYQDFDFSIGNSTTGKRYTTSSNQESDYELILNAFSLSNLDLGYRHKWKKWHARLGFRIENLFNVDYMMILWRPMTGRYYAVNLQIKWRK